MLQELEATNRETGNPIPLEATEAGEQLIAAGDARYADVTRAGSFIYRNSTAVAAVTGLPTTATNTAFRNSADDGGPSVIIDAIFALQIGNGAAAFGQWGMIYVMGQTRVASQAVDVLIPRKANGLGSTSGQVGTVVTQSIGGTALDAVTGVAIGWMPIGPSVETVVASLPGTQMWADVDGRLILPPGHIIGLHVLASQTTPTFIMGMMWHEKVIALA